MAQEVSWSGGGKAAGRKERKAGCLQHLEWCLSAKWICTVLIPKAKLASSRDHCEFECKAKLWMAKFVRSQGTTYWAFTRTFTAFSDLQILTFPILREWGQLDQGGWRQLILLHGYSSVAIHELHLIQRSRVDPQRSPDSRYHTKHYKSYLRICHSCRTKAAIGWTKLWCHFAFFYTVSILEMFWSSF